MSSESEIKESIKHLELQLMQKREELDNLQRNPLFRHFAFECKNIHSKCDEIVKALQQHKGICLLDCMMQLLTCHFVLKHGGLSRDKALIVSGLLEVAHSKWIWYGRSPIGTLPDDLEQEPFKSHIQNALLNALYQEDSFGGRILYENYDDKWYEFEIPRWALAKLGGKLYFTDCITPPVMNMNSDTMILKCKRSQLLF